eukprot:17685-Rhodomonas_salina.2
MAAFRDAPLPRPQGPGPAQAGARWKGREDGGHEGEGCVSGHVRGTAWSRGVATSQPIGGHVTSKWWSRRSVERSRPLSAEHVSPWKVRGAAKSKTKKRRSCAMCTGGLRRRKAERGSVGGSSELGRELGGEGGTREGRGIESPGGRKGREESSERDFLPQDARSVCRPGECEREGAWPTKWGKTESGNDKRAEAWPP